jgi:hypothetical protein
MKPLTNGLNDIGLGVLALAIVALAIVAALWVLLPDSDRDGFPNLFDPYPKGEDQIDSDRDGYVDSKDNWDKDACRPNPYPCKPAAPTDLKATAASSRGINLSWTDNASNESNFTVEHRPDGTRNWTELASKLSQNTTTYHDTGLSENPRHYFRVKATNAYGSSNYSNIANATPEPTAPAAAPASERRDSDNDGVSDWADGAPGLPDAGDIDNDETANGQDSEPRDPCVPNPRWCR